MKNKNLLKLTLIGAIALLSSCSIQKRTFNSGYHIEWHKRLSSNKANEKSETTEATEMIIAGNDLDQKSVINEHFENDIPVTSEVALDQNYSMESETDLTTEIKSESLDQVNSLNSQKNIHHHKAESRKQNNIKIYQKKAEKSKKVSSSANGGKLQIVALILCILLGLLGVHRFYLGYTGLGVLYILTLGLFGIGWLIDIILLIIPNGLTPKGKNNYRE